MGDGGVTNKGFVVTGLDTVINWTRTGSAVLGTAELDVDFSTDVESLRGELRAVCEGSKLWDGRVCVLQVTDAVGGNVRLRALVSAADAASLWDLRCLVRERLVAYVWQHQRDSLPRLRADLDRTAEAAPDRPTPRPPSPEPSSDAQVFAGGRDGEERGARFAGPDETTQLIAPQRS